MSQPVIVGLGGTTRAGSSTEKAVVLCLEAAAALGAQTVLLGASDLQLPMYAPEARARCDKATNLVAQLRRADGVVLGSPGYHGGISGLVKNALDYTEDLSGVPRPYLEGRAVGCIASASGWQAAATTLVALRSVVHALRGWPTPLGVAISSSESADTEQRLSTMAEQVVAFARAGLR